MGKYHNMSDNGPCEVEHKELVKCAKGVKIVQTLILEMILIDMEVEY